MALGPLHPWRPLRRSSSPLLHQPSKTLLLLLAILYCMHPATAQQPRSRIPAKTPAKTLTALLAFEAAAGFLINLPSAGASDEATLFSIDIKDKKYVEAFLQAEALENSILPTLSLGNSLPRRLTKDQYEAARSVIRAFAVAGGYAPARKEPHYHIGRIYKEIGDYKRCFDHAMIAYTLVSAPENALMVDEMVYIYGVLDLICMCGFYVDEMVVGRTACQKMKALAEEREERTKPQGTDLVKHAEDSLSYYDQYLDLTRGKNAPGTCIAVSVLSASKKRKARDAIRATWKQRPEFCKFNFYIGRPQNFESFMALENEALEFGDIIIVDIDEAYKNITHQTFEMLKTAAADPAVTHLLKLDDDSYPRMEEWHDVIAQSAHEYLFYAGYLRFDETTLLEQADRNPLGTGRDWMPWNKSRALPPFALGCGYLISAGLARAIWADRDVIYENNWFLDEAEDVSLAVWIDYVRHAHNYTVKYFHIASIVSTGICSDSDAVTHYVSADMQRCLWREGGRCSKCHAVDSEGRAYAVSKT